MVAADADPHAPDGSGDEDASSVTDASVGGADAAPTTVGIDSGNYPLHFGPYL